MCVYDVKTGHSGLTVLRVREIASATASTLRCYRKKLIKAHTSHRHGDANTLATAPAISL